jgi:hypothetical protein
MTVPLPIPDSFSWMHLVGLPYRMSADPKGAEATDCIRLVFHVLEIAGQQPPPIDRRWYPMLARQDSDGLRREWMRLSRPTTGPEQLSTTLLPEGPFAIAVVVDGGILLVRPEVGVRWVPLSNLQPLNYRRFHPYTA